MPATPEVKAEIEAFTQQLGKQHSDGKYDAGLIITVKDMSQAVCFHAKGENKSKEQAKNLVDLLHGAHGAILDMMKRLNIKPQTDTVYNATVKVAGQQEN